MFQAHKSYSVLEAVGSYLLFVPMEDEVLDFFKPVAANILKKLKARPCIPTQPDSQGRCRCVELIHVSELHQLNERELKSSIKEKSCFDLAVYNLVLQVYTSILYCQRSILTT